MDLQEDYKKESGFNVGTINTIGTTYYSNDYVEWIEAKVENLILFGVGCSKPSKEEIDFIIYKGKKYVHKTDLETLIDNGTYVEVE